MRLPRLKPPCGHPGSAFHHCLSRVVDRRFIFQNDEKAHFLALLRELEAFCRIRVLSFAILSNHFHLLLEVPPKPPPHLLPSPDVILADLSRLSGHQDVEAVRKRFELLRESADSRAFDAYLASFHARMYDLSFFMKLLKQRFTQWFNARSDRKGTLWESRFKSVLVEGAGRALSTMAAYIDLNAVRAGIVSDPKDYPWCGYGLAMAGEARAREGIQALVKVLQAGCGESPERSLEVYRIHLYVSGDEGREATGPDGLPVRKGLAREAVLAVLAARGKVPVEEYLQCRVRYFCDGTVLGGRGFVDGVFQAYRERFGARRRTGARRMRGLAGEAVFAMRDLRLRVFG